MAALINVVLPVFLVAGVAAAAQPRLRLDVRTISRASFYLFSPALVFDALVRSHLTGREFGQIAGVLVITVLVLWGVASLTARQLNLDGPARSAFLVAVLFMNAGNYGLPVALFAFGEEGLARASVYFTASALLSSSLGVYLAARGRARPAVAAQQVFKVPVTYAALLGLLFTALGRLPPEPVAKMVHLLGQAAIPVMLTVLGIQLVSTLQAGFQPASARALGAVLALRLLVSPCIALVVATALGLSALTRNVVTLQSAMPTAVMTTILATEFEADAPFVALSVFATTVLSLLTTALWLNWFL